MSWSGRPPAAASAVSRLPSATSNWPTTPSPVTCPSASSAVCPASAITVPRPTTACENPDGRASSGGLIRSMLIRVPFVSNTRYYEHRLAVAGRPAAGHYTGPVPATRAQAAPPRDLILTFYGLFREGIGGWISIAHLIRLMAGGDGGAAAV